MCAVPDSRRRERSLDSEKSRHPEVTADGSERAFVDFECLDTLWFNTGTLCNIECRRCNIDSSPVNDRLVFLTPGEVAKMTEAGQ